jgi:lipid-A-disaccharide synthase
MLAIAEQIQHQLPQVHFWIPVAPTLSLETLARFAQTETNPLVPVIDGVTAELVIKPEGRAYFKTETGLRVDLDQTFPAYERLAHCQLCLTTVGANTAELGSLGVPMLVLLPTQQLDVMRAWDGIPGILVNLPILGRFFARIINGWFVQRKGLLAWPNIWAGEEIVPELMGALTPAQVARQVVGYLQEPQQLAQMRSRLRQVRGAPGAAAKLVELVVELLD